MEDDPSTIVTDALDLLDCVASTALHDALSGYFALEDGREFIFRLEEIAVGRP